VRRGEIDRYGVVVVGGIDADLDGLSLRQAALLVQCEGTVEAIAGARICDGQVVCRRICPIYAATVEVRVDDDRVHHRECGFAGVLALAYGDAGEQRSDEATKREQNARKIAPPSQVPLGVLGGGCVVGPGPCRGLRRPRRVAGVVCANLLDFTCGNVVVDGVVRGGWLVDDVAEPGLGLGEAVKGDYAARYYSPGLLHEGLPAGWG
jgi:hypothetical protein